MNSAESDVRMIEASNSTVSLRLNELSQPKKLMIRYKHEMGITTTDMIHIDDEMSPGPNSYRVNESVIGKH